MNALLISVEDCQRNLYVELYPNRRIPNIRIFRRIKRNMRDYSAFDKSKRAKFISSIKGITKEEYDLRSG